jgi:hypothetical protein
MVVVLLCQAETLQKKPANIQVEVGGVARMFECL